jgi:hypothetical protein
MRTHAVAGILRHQRAEVPMQLPAAILALARYAEQWPAELQVRVCAARLPRLCIRQRRDRRLRNAHPHHPVPGHLITLVLHATSLPRSFKSLLRDRDAKFDMIFDGSRWERRG